MVGPAMPRSRLTAPIDLSGYSSAELTFDWLIESGFDSGEYLSLDVSSDGGATLANGRAVV